MNYQVLSLLEVVSKPLIALKMSNFLGRPNFSEVGFRRC